MKDGIGKILKNNKVLGFLVAGILIFSVFSQSNAVYAITDPTYKLTAETEGIKGFVVKSLTSLNVRSGPGRTYSKIRHPETDKTVSLSTGDLVAVMDEIDVTYDDGTTALWYEIRWVSEDNIEFHGYINSAYTEKTGDPAIPLPTPTPDPKSLPTSTPTPTPVEVTGTVTQAVMPTVAPEKPGIGSYADAESGLYGVAIVVAVLLLLFFIYGVYYNLSLKFNKNKKNPINAQLRYYERRINSQNEQKEKLQKERAEREESERIKQETVKIRKDLDMLKTGDRVIHKFFGKGEVVDNSDPDILSVKFETGIRCIDKESAALKRVLTKI